MIHLKRYIKIIWLRLCSVIYYKCHKINPNCGRSYISSLVWIKSKKTAINPINKKDNKCFQYVATVVSNHEELGKNPERITTLNKYDWEGINLPSEKDNWKKN